MTFQIHDYKITKGKVFLHEDGNWIVSYPTSTGKVAFLAYRTESEARFALEFFSAVIPRKTIQKRKAIVPRRAAAPAVAPAPVEPIQPKKRGRPAGPPKPPKPPRIAKPKKQPVPRIEPQPISQALLHQLFEYRDGDFYWKVQHGRKNVPGRQAGTVRRTTDTKELRLFRNDYTVKKLVWLYHTGQYLSSYAIEQIDGDKQNTRIENLRLRD